jgi:uncharacterized membrane protein (DUF2068 family)
MSEPIAKIAPWEDVVLRLIAIYKLTKALLALVLGLMLLHLVHKDIVLFLHTYIIDPLHLEASFDADSENHLLKWLFQQASNLTPHGVLKLSWVSFFYAAVFAVEGIGLYLKKHWAEYMVLVVTGSFLPFEAYLLYYKLQWWKFALIIGNILIIVYLVHRLMLDARARQQSELQAQEDSLAAPAETKAVATEVR